MTGDRGTRGHRSTDRRSRLRRPLFRRSLVGHAVAGAGWCGFAAYVVWQGTAGPPVMWSDSTSYATVAGNPLWSTGFWAGQRPVLVPLVLKLTGSSTAFTTLQSVVAVVAWGVLAVAVSRLVPAGWRRLVAAWLVLGFATSTPIILWNRSVLSESLSLSILALLVAALIAAARRMTWPRVAAVALAALAFAATRDAQVWTVALLGLGVAVVTLVRIGRDHRFPPRIGALAASLLVAAGATGWVVVHTGRTRQNVYDVLVVRVFPFPGRVAWFAAHGMPEAAAIDRLAAATTPLTPTSAKVVAFSPTDPSFAPLEHWIESDGQSTFLLWLVTHPGYVVTEPLERPERTYNDAHGDLTFYAAPGRVDSPLSPVLWPAARWLIPLTVIGLAAAALNGDGRERSTQVLVLLGGLGILAMLIAWQGDGQEVPRHTVEGFAQVRVCVLILVAVGLLRAIPSRRRRDLRP